MHCIDRVLGTAIPRITTQFRSLNDVGWYGSAYLLTQLSLQPTFGKLYTFFNIKLVYISALFFFEVGSTICASAPSSVIFIIGRAVAGAGSAGIWCGTFTIGTYLVPLRYKPLYISIVTSMYGVAAIAGPLLGGVFTDSVKLTWRFCFWVNLRKAREVSSLQENKLNVSSSRWCCNTDYRHHLQAAEIEQNGSPIDG